VIDLANPASCLTHVDFHGGKIAGGYDNGRIQIWDTLIGGEVVQEFMDETFSPHGVAALCLGENFLFCVNTVGLFFIWNLLTSELVFQEVIDQGGVTSIQMAPDENFVVLIGSNMFISFVLSPRGEWQRVAVPHPNMNKGKLLSINDTHYLVTGADQPGRCQISLWDLQNYQRKYHITDFQVHFLLPFPSSGFSSLTYILLSHSNL